MDKAVLGRTHRSPPLQGLLIYSQKIHTTEDTEVTETQMGKKSLVFLSVISVSSVVNIDDSINQQALQRGVREDLQVPLQSPLWRGELRAGSSILPKTQGIRSGRFPGVA